MRPQCTAAAPRLGPYSYLLKIKKITAVACRIPSANVGAVGAVAQRKLDGHAHAGIPQTA